MPLLRSPHPHAEIVSVDSSKAMSLSGVHLVLTGEDFPVTFGIMPVSQDEYPLANGKVRYVGDPIAAVIAIDEQTCTEALDLVEVNYKILKTISDSAQVAANGRAPDSRLRRARQHPPHPVLRIRRRRRGAGEFAQVFDDLFYYEGNTHLPIEQHAAVARPTAKASSRSGLRPRCRTTSTGRSRAR
ncbi:MAG: hypothetical protein HC938_11430, partial [Nitrospira sp.]|nr:hypothetical protein [Nitrospira sp.]